MMFRQDRERVFADHREVSRYLIRPLVIAHARALLTGDPRAKTAYAEADLRDPQNILDDPAVADVLDLNEPVGCC
jgi:hypothetical protein